ncbi:hypothetical protein [Paraclostridium sordellii]|uniref:hypothetical protein n=1 Tax=Paraclostridium sordellii TaxID=1505 RepID=UPI0005DB90A8|nr:hypothetical protein [Paeniclostridium sordellii]CEN93733.1 Uncharacterised protein [[Clostridium] sordellii] [Paeniclostridium sordellii]CEN95104.1 Uncharacterised protein [[Clostridium] sordellii] [Paeniclostridium sordellii]CEQ26142.1 Uncharacterised protein [[Clostridium] sordellii] [Paeniclostridium sordellii]
METSININLNDFKLPCIVNRDQDYYIKLKTYLKLYFNHVEKVERLDQDCISNTKKNIDLVLDCLALYNNAKITEAKECIKNIIEKYLDSPYILATIDKNYAFRGMAPKEIQPKQYKNYQSYEKMNKLSLSFFKAREAIENINIKDMLHIPFDKRGLISTQRFSIAGVPCLYLSTTSLGCWLELNSPQLDLFQVSSYKIPYGLKILNMCISQYVINGWSSNMSAENSEYKSACSLIELFPLVCATSFQVLEINRNFKSEYIISQLLMQVVKELNIDGVAYLSKKMEDYYAYPQCVNLAILMESKKLPPYDQNTLDMYWDRSNEIELTNPYKSVDIEVDHNEGEYHSYVNAIYNDHPQKKVLINGDTINYMGTIFSRFDEFLVKQNHYRFKT